MITRRETQFFTVAALLSLLLHLMIAGTMVLGLVPDISRLARTPPRPTPARMRLVPPPKAAQLKPMPAAAQQRFVDTTGLKEEKPLGPTPNISDRDTAVRSPMPGAGDTALPTQQGLQKPGLTFFETPESRGVKAEQPQPPAPTTTAEQRPAEPPQKPREDGAPERRLPATAMGVLPRPTEEEEREQERRREAQQQTPAQRKPPQPAAAPFEFKQDRTAIEGGAVPPGDSSVESRATPLGQYQSRVYRAIGSQWRFMVRQQRDMMDLGTVSVTFLVRRDGTLGDLRVDYNTSSSAMLQTISENSVRLVSPFPPFPESVEEQVGDELPFDVRFTIY